MAATTMMSLDGVLCRRPVVPNTVVGGKRPAALNHRTTTTRLKNKNTITSTTAAAASSSGSEFSVCPEGLPRTAKVGILGGGQLGRMLAIAAAPMGVRLNSLDPTPTSPASITAIQTEGSYGDRDDIIAFAKDCDVVTVEIEHIDTAALKELEEMGVDVQPTSKTLAIIQDKFAQKEHFQAAGVPLGDFAAVSSAADIDDVAAKFGQGRASPFHSKPPSLPTHTVTNPPSPPPPAFVLFHLQPTTSDCVYTRE